MLSGPFKTINWHLIMSVKRVFNASHQLFKAELINNIVLLQSQVLTCVKRIGSLICKMTH